MTFTASTARRRSRCPVAAATGLPGANRARSVKVGATVNLTVGTSVAVQVTAGEP